MLALADAAHWLFPATSWRWLFEELQRWGGAIFFLGGGEGASRA
jgi:hypothetical protein